VIDAVFHGESAPPSESKCVYGVPIIGFNENGKKHVSIGDTDFEPKQAAIIESKLPRGEFDAHILRSEGRWIQSPFDGTLLPDTHAMCKEPSSTAQPLYRTRSNQKGSAPFAPHIADFPTLDQIANATSADLASLDGFRPMDGAACNISFARLQETLSSPEAHAYLAAWKSEQLRPSEDKTFQFTPPPAPLESAREDFLNDFNSLEQDLANLPRSSSRRLQIAFCGIDGSWN
jgi:hypothetical protein